MRARQRIVSAALGAAGLSFIAVALFSSSASADTPAFNLNGAWSLSIHNCANVTKPHSITIINFSQSTGDFQVDYDDSGVSKSLIGVESGTSVNFDGVIPNGIVAQSGTSLVITGSRTCPNGNTYSYTITNSNPVAGSSTSTTTSSTTTTLASGSNGGGRNASSAKKTNVGASASTDFVSLKTDVPPVASKLGTPGEIFHSPTHDVVNAVITVGAVIFITFPANIFNQTFSENYDEILLIVAAWRRRVRRLFGNFAPHATTPNSAGAASVSDAATSSPEQSTPDRVTLFGFLVVLVIGSLFGGLLDPRFGINRQSLVSFGSTLLAFAWGALLSWFIARAFRRHHQYPTDTYWRALPIGLGVAIVCVLVSRLSHFQPGYLYGVVVSVAFVGSLKDRHNAHLITISTISTLSVAFAAWLVWIPFNHLALEHGSNYFYGVLDDVLASIFVGGLVGTVVGLIPLRGLPGEHLSKWRKDVWALIFFISLFLLIEVELRPASGPTHTGAASIVTIIVLFLFFGGSTIAMRVYFAKRKLRKDNVPVSQAVGVALEGEEHV
jgi:hypothetical protein